MKRITVEMVKEAYEKTGLKPCTGEVVPMGGKCCALGALSVAAGEQGGGYPGGTVTDYQVGFFHAWDGEPESTISHARMWRSGKALEHYNLGYSDGLACAAAVFGEGASA